MSTVDSSQSTARYGPLRRGSPLDLCRLEAVDCRLSTVQLRQQRSRFHALWVAAGGGVTDLKTRPKWLVFNSCTSRRRGARPVGVGSRQLLVDRDPVANGGKEVGSDLSTVDCQLSTRVDVLKPSPVAGLPSCMIRLPSGAQTSPHLSPTSPAAVASAGNLWQYVLAVPRRIVIRLRRAAPGVCQIFLGTCDLATATW